ncbi:MAG: Crp/Fnr family transcriptional regulator [Candidatus Sericytochromatia bacterium]|nr:Crp/Fnr family transcriptional regulator [Candidatus Sericytochromatia bacterium]
MGGEIFGEMAILTTGARTATATMIDGGDLILLPKDRFLEQLGQCPPMVHTMFFSLMERLRMTTERVRPSNDRSLFLSVCRALAQELETLRLQRAKAAPYRDMLRKIKDIMLVSAHEIEAVFFKLQDLGLVACHKDGIPSKTFVFTQPDGFLAGCERHYQQYADHMEEAPGDDEVLDLVDLAGKTGFDVDKLLRLAADGAMPSGVLRVSRRALANWAKVAPDTAGDARLAPSGPPAPVDEPVDTAELKPLGKP